MNIKLKAIFLDRDGVINDECGLIVTSSQIRIQERVFEAFKKLKLLNFKLIVVTNQAVVARGLCTEEKVSQINNYIADEIKRKTTCIIDKFYSCPHHPEATLKKYRKNCECRKPQAGMLLKASKEFLINLNESWMIGDRISDINAGQRVGCQTIQVLTGAHTEKPIVSNFLDTSLQANYTCLDLLEAVNLIIKQENK